MLRSVIVTLSRAAIALLAMGGMFWLLDTFPSAIFLVVLAVTCVYLVLESLRRRAD